MLLVGLTGGVGAGKSTAARRLADLGAVVVDADAVAREVVAPGTPGLAAVAAAFGASVLAPDGSLDRAVLGRLVFADPVRRRVLEGITHPRIGARTEELVAAAAAADPAAVVVHDIPLLVELGRADRYHLVAVVHAPEQERVRRLVAERGMTEADARARVAAQADDDARRAAADVWLDNAGAPDDLEARVAALWAERLVPFEANLRARRRVRRPRELRLVEPDPTWPAQGERLRARVVRAAGALGLGVEHTGSTAVPGMVAKDVVDLQLGVRSLADADRVADALADAGFPRSPGEWTDTPKPPDPDPAHWRKRLHGSADPARVVHLHVREVGGPGWRYALLFRDWLRAEPAAREDYTAVELSLAAQHALTDDHAVAEEPWSDVALPRAERWASATGWQPPAP